MSELEKFNTGIWPSLVRLGRYGNPCPYGSTSLDGQLQDCRMQQENDMDLGH